MKHSYTYHARCSRTRRQTQITRLYLTNEHMFVQRVVKRSKKRSNHMVYFPYLWAQHQTQLTFSFGDLANYFDSIMGYICSFMYIDLDVNWVNKRQPSTTKTQLSTWCIIQLDLRDAVNHTGKHMYYRTLKSNSHTCTFNIV